MATSSIQFLANASIQLGNCHHITWQLITYNLATAILQLSNCQHRTLKLPAYKMAMVRNGMKVPSWRTIVHRSLIYVMNGLKVDSFRCFYVQLGSPTFFCQFSRKHYSTFYWIMINKKIKMNKPKKIWITLTHIWLQIYILGRKVWNAILIVSNIKFY